MRCFIAITLPEEIKKKISEITKSLTEKGIKKVRESNLHLTLKFLGEVEENKIEEIKQVIEKINYKKFNVSLKNFGFFPNDSFIKVVWIGIEKGSKEIIELQKQIDLRLKDLGFKQERNFEPHLTIARVKFLENKKNFLEKIKELKFEDNFSVLNFDLMQSFLKPEGPVYKKILAVELT
jgi:2'-5' RNA ligase